MSRPSAVATARRSGPGVGGLRTRAGLPLTTTLPWGADIDPSRAVPDSPSEVYLCIGVGAMAYFGELPTVAEQHQFCTDPVPLPD